LSLLCPQGVNATSKIPGDVIFIDSLLSLGGRPDFHFDNIMSSSETESTASGMSQSDLSHEQEIGEVCGEVDDGPLALQPYQTLDFGENG
jgi:hypothetical protein